MMLNYPIWAMVLTRPSTELDEELMKLQHESGNPSDDPSNGGKGSNVSIIRINWHILLVEGDSDQCKEECDSVLFNTLSSELSCSILSNSFGGMSLILRLDE
jgi:hypothetical protein